MFRFYEPWFFIQCLQEIRYEKLISIWTVRWSRKLKNNQIPPYETFFRKLRDINSLEKDSLNFQNILGGGSTSKDALSKQKSEQPPLTGQKNYQYLTSVLQQENMRTFRDFLLYYYSKDIVPTLEAQQKMVDSYHNKGIDMLKLGCTFLNLENICLQQSTTAPFHPFAESNKGLLEEISEDMVGENHPFCSQGKLLWKNLLLGIR